MRKCDFEFEKLEQIYLNMDKLETLLKEISEIVLKRKDTTGREKEKR